jgi:hypothetical protein
MAQVSCCGVVRLGGEARIVIVKIGCPEAARLQYHRRYIGAEVPATSSIDANLGPPVDCAGMKSARSCSLTHATGQWPPAHARGHRKSGCSFEIVCFLTKIERARIYLSTLIYLSMFPIRGILH